MNGALWAILGVSIVLMGVLSLLVIRLTVTVSRSSTNALASLVAIDARHSALVKSLVDRMMGMDWEAVRLHEGAEGTEEGGFIAPEEQTAYEPDPAAYGTWARASSAQERADLLDEVTQLASDDDLDSYRAEQGARP
jgi:hypothetical protein